jgi:hypothetical protein
MTASLAGCTGLSSGGENSRLDLTVQNDGSDSMTIQLEVVDDEGTTYRDESIQIDGGATRTFEIGVGTDGNCEATISGENFQSQLSWNADGCAHYEGTIRLTSTSVETSSTCAQSR